MGVNMKTVFRQNQLFTFLLYCNDIELKKEVLDCGAGGNCPPLAIFAEHGYKTHGIEIDDKQLELAKKFEAAKGLDLGIIKGDMKDLPYEDNSISFIYSYNSIFHMSKKEIEKVIIEIRRVLPVGGLTFINFASTHDQRSCVGKQVGAGEYLQVECGEEVLHSFFDDNEAEGYFQGFDILYKENRIREGRTQNGGKIRLGFIDYILEKKLV
jgi:cyclopropane fatty-acyl-phospholipid synthase-like methyltransferase